MFPGLDIKVAEDWAPLGTVERLILGDWLVAFPGIIVSEMGTVICCEVRWALEKGITLCNRTLGQEGRFKLAKLTPCGRLAVFELDWAGESE